MPKHILRSSDDLARLSELIDSIYQCATSPSHWNSTLPAIADWVDAQYGLLFTPLNAPENGGFYFNHAIPQHFMELWGTRYLMEDVWAQRGNECGLMFESNVINGDHHVPFEELSKTTFYQEFLSKLDIAHLLSGIVFGVNSPPGNPIVVCSWFRGLGKGKFNVDEQKRLALLLPHLSRALGVMAQLRDAELKTAASLAALERLNAGILLFDADGTVSFANHAARRILEEEDGFHLRHLVNNSSYGEVIADDQNVHDTLTAAISSAVSPDFLHTEHFSHAVKVPRPSGRPDYVLNFSSLALHNEFGSGSDAPRAIAFITDNAEPIRIDPDMLRQTYRLTPAEIRLASALVECLTVDETAKKLDVSRSTVKAQQQSIYEKTNTNTRAKLMKLLISLAQLPSLAGMTIMSCASDFADGLLWLPIGHQLI